MKILFLILLFLSGSTTYASECEWLTETQKQTADRLLKETTDIKEHCKFSFVKKTSCYNGLQANDDTLAREAILSYSPKDIYWLEIETTDGVRFELFLKGSSSDVTSVYVGGENLGLILGCALPEGLRNKLH